MPNWCSNELHIFGEPENIKHFMEANKGFPACYDPANLENVKPVFCFNALVPTPQSVLDLGYDASFKLRQIKEEKGEEATVGMIDGYHWNRFNWGTKWDIACENLSLENCGWEEGLTEFVLYFSTAWTPPVAWLLKVAPMFPKLEFQLHYEEPGCLMAGDVFCEGDSFSVERYDDDRCEELFSQFY